MLKDGYLYGEIRRAQIKFLLANIFFTVLFLVFSIAKFPYIKTKMQGPKELDTDRFLKESSVVVIDEIVELGRKETKTLSSAIYRESSYWQDGNYYYTVELDNIKDAGKAFTQTIVQGPSAGTELETGRLYVADVGGGSVALLAPPHWEGTAKVRGYLTGLSKPVVAKLSQTVAEGGPLELCEYMLDIRNIEMETENSDVIVFWVALFLLLFFWIKLLRNFKKPETASAMKQLIKYGDMLSVAKEVDRQAVSDTAYREGKILVMEDYIAFRTPFGLKVERNHMAKH